MKKLENYIIYKNKKKNAKIGDFKTTEHYISNYNTHIINHLNIYCNEDLFHDIWNNIINNNNKMKLKKDIIFDLIYYENIFKYNIDNVEIKETEELEYSEFKYKISCEYFYNSKNVDNNRVIKKKLFSINNVQ